jgi:hypothetical protein
LATIAGLNFANIKPASASSTATSTGTGTSASTNTSSPDLTTSYSGLSTGAKAGIGVDVACGVMLALSVLFWVSYWRQRQNNQTENINHKSSSGRISVGPVPELPATEGQTQELDSVAIHEAGYEANKPEGGGVQEPLNRDKTVYKLY